MNRGRVHADQAACADSANYNGLDSIETPAEAFDVVTAARDAQAGWLLLQDRMATLSTNSSHRVVPYTHDALVNDQTAAQTSSQAIRDVVHAVRCGNVLKKS